jgi:histidinol-phosphate phosphatase family protein
MQAVIMAGGKGTRLLELTKDELPKPMIPVADKPILQWQIECLCRNDITDICIVVGHLGEKIEEYFGNGNEYGVNISYYYEETPLGSAGALAFIKQNLTDDYFLLVFGDTVFDADISRMETFHKGKRALATLFVHPNSHPYDSDLVILDTDSRITGFDSKNNVRDYWYDNMVNAGLYILSKDICEEIPGNGKTDLEKDVLIKLCEQRAKIYGYVSTEYIKDAGTADRIKKVEYDVKSGTVAAKNLSKPQKCVFLDRDGVLNKYVGLLYDIEKLELEDNVIEAVAKLNSSEYLTIVVTNQPVVARGLCDVGDVYEIHKKLQTLLGENHVYLDDILFCPHHPDKGYPEENKDYKIDCGCRKPKIGMLKTAALRHNIELSKSWIIGDTTSDIKAGSDSGTQTILVMTGEAGRDEKYKMKPDYVADDLLDAVNCILGG